MTENNNGDEEGLTKHRDMYTKSWIQSNAIRILATYSGQITVRQLYYRLVAIGMTNDVNHYKRVVNAMTDSRWSGDVQFDAFIDRERVMFWQTQAADTDFDTEVEQGKRQVGAWMENYHLNRWENQNTYVEVWIEKKALQGVFEGPCKEAGVGLAPCKGYPSLTFLHEARQRFNMYNGEKNLVMLYFGDYDPSGEDIPRSLKENIRRMGCDIEVKRIALNKELIEELGLPSAPTKMTDSRSANWDGEGAVELDAVEPNTLKNMCEDAIEELFDSSLYEELEEREQKERKKYQKELRDFVLKMK
jgi:hypothetical protein